ncbi:S-layer homology domain-containing protein [Bifidobacterium miconisargentati]|uniref:S-layer homology domain-containing protein n=1 Tax=Bifidobacterium miconisargentati TaxID=2834437 RepID=UPI001BDD5107|nr:S-layer homology domain-containing protein [Bifidobacterium miconisargentati]MBW3091136.1 S-layer homology domain-containing protein [Bifidobacterium miconisargentati]
MSKGKLIAAIAATACMLFGTAAPAYASSVPTSKDFLEWMQEQPLTSDQQQDVSDALDLFSDAPDAILQKTELGNVQDATSLRNMIIASGSVLNRIQQLRQQDGGSSTSVSLTNTIQAQLNANYSTYSRNHSGWFPFPGAENLAMGYDDPTEGWYDEEKQIFDQAAAADPQVEECRYDTFCSNAPSGVGHYQNMVYPEFDSVGLAVSHLGWTTWVEDISPSDGTFTVSEYQRYLAEFNSQFITFEDVTDATSHADDIYWLAKKGISTGWNNPDGTKVFRPTAQVTRQDYAAFLYRLAGSPAIGATSKSFSDVNASTPHHDAILWAASNGIINGYGDGTFRGMASIQRQDAMVMLYRLAGKPDTAITGFTDTGSLSVEFQTAVAWAKSSGVSTGYSDGSFGVGRTIIRQDMAAFLHRAQPQVDGKW